ncbi:MAG: hypothetical protein MUE65_03655, partial [Methanomassiliicoccales archaeon]|nr:hypothetical protein [Methanomassiliicoccales archaeon]
MSCNANSSSDIKISLLKVASELSLGALFDALVDVAGEFMKMTADHKTTVANANAARGRTITRRESRGAICVACGL